MANVMVTGGSRGIGAAAVKRFAAAGHRVFFLYEKEHEAVLNLVDRILSKVGYEKANEVIQMFSLIASVAQREIQ